MPLNRETSETPTFTEEAITFRGSAGNLFCTAKTQLLGHDFICVTVCSVTACRPPVCNGTACKGLAANGSAAFVESQ